MLYVIWKEEEEERYIDKRKVVFRSEEEGSNQSMDR
jgi:hypothetical protein